ncbi:arginase [Clostridium acetobutylicum]|uniref:Arginase n=1 Tax=Clostridium acetobutylicum (strain ATCC 824 / DSM 792 / JCM 1419 / IAM 19013 / LMG 5710 / NBRC 13948 / NRRL B-527 / VKM B-1787 / 2291 / W) TaxID=272562 RepID=Q97K65_CLOAB|nr:MULTISPECIES: arginase [Clostridium]AAK79030.1 Arginase [Clostridium acetobutylicum ATCC 824]ADZ20105.1 Arginase [Clostridium acetobutylicum EA 2018]AEI31580.1 arginase [Clostridium acetobutylicum DSM 1731]AWV81714.1 arginase [Clostridium acetobutylicum]MBC2395256.1 arginase [Clostridium acetobutylicum]
MNIDILGVPIYYGSDRKGVDLGPSKLREKNLASLIAKYNHNVKDMGDVNVPFISEKDKFKFNDKMKFLKPIVEANTELANKVYESLSSGNFPFVVGGDHSLGLGSITGASKALDNLAVIWIDAHTDINTDKTTETGNVHGMPLSAAMGIGASELTNICYNGQKVKPENVFIIGARSIDKGELALIYEKNLTFYSTKTVKRLGVEYILKEITEKLSKNNINSVHLSFDIDCLDETIVPGTGTPVSDGLNVDDTKLMVESLVKSGLVKSMDLVEFNPALDKDHQTEDLVMEFIDCIFKNLK